MRHLLSEIAVRRRRHDGHVKRIGVFLVAEDALPRAVPDRTLVRRQTPGIAQDDPRRDEEIKPGIRIQGIVQGIADVPAHTRPRHERKRQLRPGRNAPAGKGVGQGRIVVIDAEPFAGWIEESAKTECRVDEKPLGRIPRQSAFAHKEIGNQTTRILDVLRKILDAVNQRLRNNGRVQDAKRIDDILHAPVEDRKHRPIERFPHVLTAELAAKTMNRPRPIFSRQILR